MIIIIFIITRHQEHEHGGVRCFASSPVFHNILLVSNSMVVLTLLYVYLLYYYVTFVIFIIIHSFMRHQEPEHGGVGASG